MNDVTFEFNPERHEYRVNGVRWPSITQCMRSSGIVNNDFGTDYHLWVGTATHRAIELHVKGKLDMRTLDPALVPRLDAWIEFVELTGFKAIATEKSVYSMNLRCCGTLDVLGKFPQDESEAIVEIKSGNVSKLAGVQTAGQDLLLGGDSYRKRFGISVPASGKPRVTEFHDIDDYTVFRACVTIHNWKS